MKRLKQAWKRDPLTVAALGAVVLGFLMWAAPVDTRGFRLESERLPCSSSYAEWQETGAISLELVRVYFGCGGLRFYWAEDWFQFDRIPAVLFFFTLAAFLFWRGTEQNIRRR